MYFKHRDNLISKQMHKSSYNIYNQYTQLSLNILSKTLFQEKLTFKNSVYYSIYTIILLEYHHRKSILFNAAFSTVICKKTTR